jgi:hypothetical protein
MKELLAVILLLAATAGAQTTVQVPYTGSSTVTTTLAPGTVAITVVCPNAATATISGTTVTCPSSTPGPARTKLTPSGGNDQAIIYGAAAKGPIELACGATGCVFRLSSSTLPSGADIWIDDGVTVQDLTAYTGFAHLFALSGLSGVTIAGSGSATAGKLSMPLTYAKNFGAAGFPVNMCIWMETSSNISISGLRFDQCGGDSIYIGKGSTNVHVTKVVSTNPVRNGCSVTDQLTNVLIDYSDFSGAHNKAAGIMDGCDAEPNGTGQATPNPGQFTKQVVFDHDKFHDNGQDGICFCLYFMSSTVPLDYTVTNSDSTNNSGTNFEKSNWPSAMTGPVQFVKGSGNTTNGFAVPFPGAGAKLRP